MLTFASLSATSGLDNTRSSISRFFFTATFLNFLNLNPMKWLSPPTFQYYNTLVAYRHHILLVLLALAQALLLANRYGVSELIQCSEQRMSESHILRMNLKSKNPNSENADKRNKANHNIPPCCLILYEQWPCWYPPTQCGGWGGVGGGLSRGQTFWPLALVASRLYFKFEPRHSQVQTLKYLNDGKKNE